MTKREYGVISYRHIFNRFRFHLRFMAVPIMLSFGIIDYLYAPEYFTQWFSYRLLWAVTAIGAFELAKKNKFLRKNIDYLAICITVVAAWSVNLMIYQYKGHLSIYSTGIILITTFGIQLFRLDKRRALLLESLTYGPAIVVFWHSAGLENWKIAVIQSAFPIGMMLISFVYGNSDEQVQKISIKFKKMAKLELEKYRRTEVLKNHFPKSVRESFERNPNEIQKKRLLTDAVVGFADIVSSSKISNAIELRRDWDLKEKFLEAATKRAMESNMVVLTHMGDGFMFLANYLEGDSWSYNLITFYENLLKDYNEIWGEMSSEIGDITSGVKFGVSSGAILVGFIGKSQSYFSAVGPDVNLAARLCAQAGPNEIVVSARVWNSLKPILIGWSFDSKIYDSLKGFSYEVKAIHIKPRFLDKKEQRCAECGEKITLVKTEEGFVDFQCVNGHSTVAQQNLLKKVS